MARTKNRSRVETVEKPIEQVFIFDYPKNVPKVGDINRSL